MKVKNAFNPIPGASPIGQLAKKPIKKEANAAARQVPTNIAPRSMPVADIICGLTKMMYAIVINVVKPPNISFFMFVLFASSSNNWFR